MSDKNFIIVHLRSVLGSTVEALLREGIEKKFADIKVLENSFYDLPLLEKSQAILKLIDPQKQNYIVFYPAGYLLSISPSLIKILRQLSPQTLLILYLIDSIDRLTSLYVSSDEWIPYFKMFDYVFTFDLYESKKYNFLYHHEPLTIFNYLNDQKDHEKYGVFFVGQAKGREKFLFDIARYLQENDILYTFYIFSRNLIVPSDIKSVHIINERIKYKELITKYVHYCSCLLSITSQYAHGITLSGYEGVLYNKKVISNCDMLEEYPFFDHRFMRKIAKVEDIDLAWLKDTTPVQYDYDKTKFSLDHHLDELTNMIENHKDDYKIFVNSPHKRENISLQTTNESNTKYSIPYKDIKKHFPAYRIFFKPDCGTRFKDEDLLYFKSDTVMEMFCSIWQGNNLCSVGSFSYLCSPVVPFMHIGRYVSIESGLIILPDSHPTDWISTSPYTYGDRLKLFALPLQTEWGKFLSPIYKAEEAKITIENDVWIGKNVSLQKGIRIYNGAIVSHNSVVTTDVPPYAIVSGSPAKVIGFRFKQDIIERLLELQWWKYNITDLNGLHFNQIDLFIEEFNKLQPSLEPFVPLVFKPFDVYLQRKALHTGL